MTIALIERALMIVLADTYHSLTIQTMLLKEDVSANYTFILRNVSNVGFLTSRGPSGSYENQVAGQFLFYLLPALQCTNFSGAGST